MRRSLKLMLLVLALVLLGSCAQQLPKSNAEPYYAEPIAQFNQAQQIGDEIYYINQMDSRLYIYIIDTNKSNEFFDKEMFMSAKANNYLIYIDIENNLVVYDLVSNKTLSISKRGYSNIIYDDRIVYINENSELEIIDYYGEIISIIDGKEIKKLIPFKDEICYVTINNKFSPNKNNSIMLMDLNGNYIEKVKDRFVYSIFEKGEWLYIIYLIPIS